MMMMMMIKLTISSAFERTLIYRINSYGIFVISDSFTSALRTAFSQTVPSDQPGFYI